jgi:hypothetical protein
MYVPVDVNFPDDDKIEAVGFEGAGLYVMALCLAKRLNSDGRLTRVKLRKLGASDAQIDALVAADLVRVDGPDAVVIAAWLAHNDDAATVAHRRAEDAARKRRTRGKRPTGHTADAPDTSGRSPVVESRDRDRHRGKRSSAADAAAPRLIAPPSFQDFWQAYPRKRDRPAAEKAWAKAVKRADPAVIVAAAADHRTDPNRDEAFTRYPATWLNGDGWADGPLPPRTSSPAPNRVQSNLDRLRQQIGLDTPTSPERPRNDVLPAVGRLSATTDH